MANNRSQSGLFGRNENRATGLLLAARYVFSPVFIGKEGAEFFNVARALLGAHGFRYIIGFSVSAPLSSPYNPLNIKEQDV